MFSIRCFHFTMLMFAVLAWGGSVAYADGGILVSKKQGEHYDVSLFAGPSPLRAGPVEVSVLLQKHGGEAALLNAEVHARFRHVAEGESGEGWKAPCCQIEQVTAAELRRDHSANRLLYGSWISLAKSGLWEMQLEVAGPAGREVFVLPMELTAPRSPLFSYWPFLVLPIFFSGLLVVNRRSRSE
ncbi:MAG: hypothetical protein ACK5LK_01155 [Chthoniobacterales bacterium]